MSTTNIVATIDYVDKKYQNLDNRITHHYERYTQTHCILTDTVSGYDYVVEMRDGNLVSYIKCTSIQVDKLPDKTSGKFDPAGLVVSAVCVDGSTREITNYTLSYVIDGVVTVTYLEAGVEYITTFNTDMYSIEKLLIDFEYIENEDGTYTLTGWKETLNGEPSTEMIIPDSNLIRVEV